MKRAWLGILRKPKETFRALLASKEKKCTLVLYGLHGVLPLLASSRLCGAGGQLGAGFVWFFCLLFSLPVGWFGITVESCFLFLFGKFVGGRGKYLQIREAVLWTNVPLVGSFIVWLYWGFLFGASIFVPVVGGTHLTAFILGCVFLGGFMLWCLSLLFLFLREVQKVSCARVVINMVLAIVCSSLIFSFFRVSPSYHKFEVKEVKANQQIEHSI